MKKKYIYTSLVIIVIIIIWVSLSSNKKPKKGTAKAGELQRLPDPDKVIYIKKYLGKSDDISKLVDSLNYDEINTAYQFSLDVKSGKTQFKDYESTKTGKAIKLISDKTGLFSPLQF
jgi:uncharacterized alpha/beta hydrolase family protein